MSRVALTRLSADGYAAYGRWLRTVDTAVELVELEGVSDPAAVLRTCHGLVLPGGADVDPARYGNAHARALCTVDAARDALEFAMLRIALDRRLPVLGVCRGLQVVTVALGGTLVPDLPSVGFTQHGGTVDGDATHPLTVEDGTLLSAAAGMLRGTVNSAHHQAVLHPAPGLRISARAADGVIEALEWEHAAASAYLLLVQWHPERMPDGSGPFAGALAASFLSAVRSDAAERKTRGG